MDSLQHNIGRWYDINEVNGKTKGYKNDKLLKEFIKNGKYDFVPDLNPNDYDSDTELKEA